MAINSRQVQTQAQQQVQTLSPQQILAVKLLELPTVELEERIHSELLDNPALEEGKEHTEEAEGHEDDYPADENEESGTDYNDDLSLGDYRTEDDIPDYKLQENNRSKGETPEEIPFSDSVSFYETLKEQLDMQDLTPEEKQLGEYLIGSLDDDGLLRKTTEALMDELAIYQGIYTTPEQLEHILSIIQDFDPAGIGRSGTLHRRGDLLLPDEIADRQGGDSQRGDQRLHRRLPGRRPRPELGRRARLPLAHSRRTAHAEPCADAEPRLGRRPELLTQRPSGDDSPEGGNRDGFLLFRRGDLPPGTGGGATKTVETAVNSLFFYYFRTIALPTRAGCRGEKRLSNTNA